MRTRLQFGNGPAAPPHPARCDAALLVGAVSRRTDAAGLPTPLPAGLEDWWTRTMGWPEHERRGAGLPRQDRLALLNVPVPIENPAQFDALFLADRPLALPPGTLAEGEAAPRLPCALAAALRAFFAAGGRRCYVIRTGEAWAYPTIDASLGPTDPSAPALLPLDRRPLAVWLQDDAATAGAETPTQRLAARVSPLPGWQAGAGSVAEIGPVGVDSHWARWRGADWLLGLPDAALLLLPDLPEACAAPGRRAAPPRPVGLGPEPFAPCTPSDDDAALTALHLHGLAAPALDDTGASAWRQLLAQALRRLAGSNPVDQRRDVQLIASLPLPLDPLGHRLAGRAQASGAVSPSTVRAALAPWLDAAALADGDDREAQDLLHAQLQLAWPWLSGPRCVDLPQGLEAPEGAFAGLLAAGTLARGAHRSVALQPALGVTGTWPRWTEREARLPLPLAALGESRAEDWLCLCVPDGHREDARHLWLSDRTTAQDRQLRIGALRRLLAQVLRHARLVGQAYAFEPSNEATWARLRLALDGLGERLRRAGALSDSVAPAQAWEVIVDRRSMSQADLDAGRLIARLHFQPALPVERIRVDLVLREGRPPQLTGRFAAEAA